MEKIQLISKLNVIEPERGYWFVRTDNGNHFDTYTENGFISIGWNEITLENILKLSKSEVHQKIASTYNIDLSLSRGKSKVSSIYNKLKRFKDIQKGDVVVVPSYASGRLAFGIVDDTNVYIDVDKTLDCEHFKRKKINWITIKNIGSLDPIFYEIKISRHAISNIKSYEDYIDRIMSTFYFKDNFGNLVFEVNQNEDINLVELIDLIGNIHKLLHEINEFYGYNEKIDECIIKLSLQSKGKFALKEEVGKSLATLAIILAMNGSKSKDPISYSNKQLSQVEIQNATVFMEQHKDTLDRVDTRMDTLEVDRSKFNNLIR